MPVIGIDFARWPRNLLAELVNLDGNAISLVLSVLGRCSLSQRGQGLGRCVRNSSENLDARSVTGFCSGQSRRD